MTSPRPIVERSVDRLAWPDRSIREAAMAAPPTIAAHRRLAASIEALNAIEVRKAPVPAAPSETFAIAAWNLERCKFIGPTVERLTTTAADICLLTEMDLGMARSGNRHTTAEVADGLGMGYAFATEFVELGLGDERERAWHAGETNAAGLHGNAVLSRFAITKAAVIPLDPGGQWFRAGGETDQRRIGGRIALACRIETTSGPCWVASVHFEIRLGPADRDREMAALLAGLDRIAGDRPIVIGGDFNTAAMPLSEPAQARVMATPERLEPMFERLRAGSYDWLACNTPAPTMRQLADGKPEPPFNKIDWFFTRGLTATGPRVVAAIDRAGRPISDHECLAVMVTIGR